MGAYNTIFTDIACLRCGETSEMYFEVQFGDTSEMKELRIGDVYPWIPGKKAVHNGGRPDSGKWVGEGYTECPKCKKDFFATITVENDIIVAVSQDKKIKPYIPD